MGGFNLDGMNIWGRSHDLTVVGHGSTTIEDDLVPAAARQGRRVQPDPFPELGAVYAGDQFPFVRRGVPILSAGGGYDLREGGVAAANAAYEAFIRTGYHQPDDEWDPDWDLGGMAEDVELFYRVGSALASSDRRPRWKAEGGHARLPRPQGCR